MYLKEIPLPKVLFADIYLSFLSVGLKYRSHYCQFECLGALPPSFSVLLLPPPVYLFKF